MPIIEKRKDLDNSKSYLKNRKRAKLIQIKQNKGNNKSIFIVYFTFSTNYMVLPIFLSYYGGRIFNPIDL